MEELRLLSLHDIMVDILEHEKEAGKIMDMQVTGQTVLTYFSNGERKIYYIK